MSTEENKALARRYIEDIWNKQNLALVDELFSADYVHHSLPPGIPPTRDGLKQFASMYWSAFPDGRLDIADQVAEGDTVVTRWTGRGTHTGQLMQIAPTGQAGGRRGHHHRPSGGRQVRGILGSIRPARNAATTRGGPGAGASASARPLGPYPHHRHRLERRRSRRSGALRPIPAR
jgi:predicted ester cyclase